MDALVKPSKRFADHPTSTGKRVNPSPAAEAMMLAHNRRGVQPPCHLFEYAKPHITSITALKNLCTDLYHEDNTPNKATYFRRPAKEFYGSAKAVHDTYYNTKAADRYLLDRKLTTKPSESISQWFYHHDFFLSCVVSSIELACRRDAKSEFLGEEVLITEERVPSGKREMPCEIQYRFNEYDEARDAVVPTVRKSKKALLPDAYFAIKRTENGQSRFRAYFLEVDRDTEALWSPDLDSKSWLSTFLKYIEVIESGYYKKHFGLTAGVMVLILCSDADRIKKIQKVLGKISGGKYKTFFLFKTWHEFQDELYVPKEVNYSLYDTPWPVCGDDPETSLSRLPVHLWDLFGPQNH